MIKDNQNVFKGSAYFGKNGIIELDGESKRNESHLIDAVDKYFKLNYYELYYKNDLEAIFMKARENKDVEKKIINAITKFILN
ncbi:hypothetical protein [Clostridium sp.]|uniref:hypothetical protein n=1 Tax=Clostridium sp. TaxID=1506 RepID=UPI00283FE5A8|nr:hypothetical protein [Clostridium sp.]MDR3596800.1 hypothetical protein [Clostridium sp.]